MPHFRGGPVIVNTQANRLVAPRPRAPIDPGQIVHQFSFDGGTSGWGSITGNGTLTDETTLVKHGKSSLRLTASTGAGNQSARKSDLWGAVDLSVGQPLFFDFRFWIDDTGGSPTFGTLDFFSNNGNTNAGYINIPESGGALRSGWNHIFGRIASYGNTGLGGTFRSNQVTGIGFRFASASTSNVMVADHVRFYRSPGFGPPGQGVGQISIVVDDSTSSQPDILRRLNARGFKAGWAAIRSFVESGVSGYATIAQLDEAYANGNLILNHSKSHKSGPYNWAHPNTSLAEAEDEIASCREWLIANGWVDGADIFVVPYGLGSDSTTEASQAKIDMAFKYCNAIITTWPSRSPYNVLPYATSTNQDLPAPLLEDHRRIIQRVLNDNDASYPFNSTAIDRIRDNRFTGIVMLHLINGTSGYHTSATFETALAALETRARQGSIRVRRIDELLFQ